jgi:hypothetical protein
VVSSIWDQVKVWWAQPTRLILVPSQSLMGSAHQTYTCSEETTQWETLQKHWVGVKWDDLSNQTHQQRRLSDRNTRLAQTLDRCNKAQRRLHWRPINIFCKINSFLKRKYTVCRTFEMIHVFWCSFTRGYHATCLGHLSGHFQGGIIKNTISSTKLSEPFQHWKYLLVIIWTI